MADVSAALKDLSPTSGSNNPQGSTSIAAGLDDNLREIQGNFVRGLSHKGADIASDTTTDLGAVEGLMHDITGTTTITSFGTVRAGIWKLLKFEGALLLTHHATSLILPGGSSIITAVGDTLLAQSEGSGNWRVHYYQRANGYAAQTLGRGHIAGLALSNNAGDATNDIDIAVGEARDTSNAKDLRLTGALTKRLDASWAVGTNQGGLDTGSIANDVYHVFLIMRSDTGVVDVLFSASAGSPTMPANYDYKRRIGAFIRSGGAILAFSQFGDEFLLNAIVTSVNNAACSATAADVALTVPDGVKVTARVRINLTATNGVGFLISSKDESDQGPGNTGAYSLVCANNTEQAAGHCDVRTDTSANVRVRSSTTNGTYSVGTYGWIDTRGRND